MGAIGAREVPQVDLDALESLLAAATPGEWGSMRYGNARLASGVLVGRSLVVGPERPTNPSGLAEYSAGFLGTVSCRDEDADLIVALRNAAPSLLTELRAARDLALQLTREYYDGEATEALDAGDLRNAIGHYVANQRAEREELVEAHRASLERIGELERMRVRVRLDEAATLPE